MENLRVIDFCVILLITFAIQKKIYENKRTDYYSDC